MIITFIFSCEKENEAYQKTQDLYYFTGIELNAIDKEQPDIILNDLDSVYSENLLLKMDFIDDLIKEFPKPNDYEDNDSRNHEYINIEMDSIMFKCNYSSYSPDDSLIGVNIVNIPNEDIIICLDQDKECMPLIEFLSNDYEFPRTCYFIINNSKGAGLIKYMIGISTKNGDEFWAGTNNIVIK